MKMVNFNLHQSFNIICYNAVYEKASIDHRPIDVLSLCQHQNRCQYPAAKNLCRSDRRGEGGGFSYGYARKLATHL